MVDAPSNEPKVLIEFTPEEIKWIADHFSDVFWGCSAAKMSVAGDPEATAKLQAKQEMAARFMNRVVDKASDQGFGDL